MLADASAFTLPQHMSTPASTAHPIEALTPSTAFQEIAHLYSSPAGKAAPQGAQSRRVALDNAHDSAEEEDDDEDNDEEEHDHDSSEREEGEEEEDGSEDVDDDGEEEEEEDDDVEDEGEERQEGEAIEVAEEPPIDWESVDATAFFNLYFNTNNGADTSSSSRTQLKPPTPAPAFSPNGSAIPQAHPQPQPPLQAAWEQPAFATATSPYASAPTPQPDYGAAIDLLTTVLGSGQEVPPEVLTMIFSSIQTSLGYGPATTPSGSGLGERGASSGSVDSLVPILRDLIEKQSQQQQRLQQRQAQQQQQQQLAAATPPGQAVTALSDWQSLFPSLVPGQSINLDDEEDDEDNDPSYVPWTASFPDFHGSPTYPNIPVQGLSPAAAAALAAQDRTRAYPPAGEESAGKDESQGAPTAMLYSSQEGGPAAKRVRLDDSVPSSGDRVSTLTSNQGTHSSQQAHASSSSAPNTVENPLANPPKKKNNRGRKPVYQTDADRKAARRESSRRAQQRFRDRNKARRIAEGDPNSRRGPGRPPRNGSKSTSGAAKRDSLESAGADELRVENRRLAAEVKRLRAENARLKERLRVGREGEHGGRHSQDAQSDSSGDDDDEDQSMYSEEHEGSEGEDGDEEGDHVHSGRDSSQEGHASGPHHRHDGDQAANVSASKRVNGHAVRGRAATAGRVGMQAIDPRQLQSSQ